MKKVKLKNTDLILSNICYGTGNFGERLHKDEAFHMLDTFVDLGGNFIDTANVYCRWVPGLGNSSEQYIGQWLKERNAYHDIVIATKGGHYDFSAPEISRVSKKEIQKDLEESLRTLGKDCIDFYWLHRDDETVDIREIIDMMEDFVVQGKIRYYGASNYGQERVTQAKNYAEKNNLQGFSAVSNQWSIAKVNKGGDFQFDPTLVMMDGNYYEWHKETQTPLVPFSVSSQGFFDKQYRNVELSEKMKKMYLNEENMKKYQKMCRLKEQYGVSMQAVTLAWFLNQPFQVFPVTAVSSEEQMKDFEMASELVLDI